jgi:hypothetical protein
MGLGEEYDAKRSKDDRQRPAEGHTTANRKKRKVQGVVGDFFA